MKSVDSIRNSVLCLESIFLGVCNADFFPYYLNLPAWGRFVVVVLSVCLFLETPSIIADIIIFLKDKQSKNRKTHDTIDTITFLKGRLSKNRSHTTDKEEVKSKLFFYYFYSFCVAMILVKNIDIFHNLHYSHSFVLHYTLFILTTVVLFFFIVFIFPILWFIINIILDKYNKS
jgi:hypothetical protein